jgi:acyl-coenzyme A synthetase/AMP-(fatty) acid ligase/thioesterase domain-containing protein
MAMVGPDEGWRETTIADRFASVAASHGEQPAIAWPGGQWSYSVLEARRTWWAGHLSTAPAERPIAILLPRGPELIAAVLGAATLGRPWTVLAHRAPRATLRTTIEALGRCTLVCEAIDPALAAGLDVHWAPVTEGAKATLLAESAAPASPATICFTSGSTGDPKGVVLRHDSTLWNARQAAVSLRLTPEDRYLWLSSVSSAATSTALFCPLLSGACVLPFDLAERGLVDLAAWIRDGQATVFHAIPGVFRRLARSVADAQALGGLRVVKLGGEAVFPSDVALFAERFGPQAELINGLGMSEANGNVCHEHVSRTEHFAEAVPIGRALPGFTLTVCGDDGQPAPTGSAGRLRIVGRSLAEGYWDRDTGRAIAFPSCPEDPAQRIFQSQDRCLMQEDGRLLHLGRSDGVVKVRGVRVSLAGLEARLREIAGVGDVVVDAGPAGGEPRISAWVEPLADAQPDARALREALARRLPREAVPAELTVVARFPTLAGGKVDRRRLLEDARAGAPGAAAPDTRAGRMAMLFAQALGRPEFGCDEDFFAAGGDSLAAVTLAAAVEAEWNCCIDPAALDENPTPAKLASALDSGSLRPAFRLAVGGAGAPLWLIGGAGDSAFYLLPLARALNGRGPVYGFLAGVDAAGRAAAKVETMTGAMFEVVRKVQPRGPYLLAGTSFGGWLAFDLAQRLTAAGETVAFLGMLDAYGPGYPRFAPSASAGQIAEHWDQRIFRWYRVGRGELMSRLTALIRRAVYVVRLWRRQAPAELKRGRAKWLSGEACFWAKRRYRLRVYPGRITVFAAEQPLPGAYREDPELGWGAWTQRPIRSVRIAGAHGVHMHEVHARGLAEALVEEINRELDW